MIRDNTPDTSETAVGEWLRQIGATNIEFEGDKAKIGPPDWTVEHQGRSVAVEVSRLDDTDGEVMRPWIRFSRQVRQELDRIMPEVQQKLGHGWHVAQLEYDEDQSRPPEKKGEEARWWKNELRERLFTERDQLPPDMWDIQLAPANMREGRGVHLLVVPASPGNPGSSTVDPDDPKAWLPITPDSGFFVIPVMEDRVCERVREKAQKVLANGRERQRDQWLVLDDQILIASSSTLNEDDRKAVMDKVRDAVAEDGVWDKVVLMSRYIPIPGRLSDAPPDDAGLEELRKQDKTFWPMWEASENPPLPSIQ